MGLPAGVTTATVTTSAGVSFTGTQLSRIVSIVPSVPIVHTASGIPLVNMIESQAIVAGGSGSFVLPHVDQNGFQDGSGASYKNWYYVATIQDLSPSSTAAPVTKNFQVLVGQSTVDLDLLPTGTPAVPWSAPAATVTSVVGQTGTVTGTQIAADPALSTTYAPAESGVTAWAASTVYTAGNIVRNPSGHVVTVLTAHTSTSTYDASKFTTPLGYMSLGGTPGIIVLKESGDTRPGVHEWIHDSPTGYLLHLMTGPNAGAGAALIGLGGDNAGTCLFVNNKATGKGISIQQNDTITSPTAYAFYGAQKSTVAPFIHIDQLDGAQKSFRIVTSETTDDLKDCFQIISPGTNKGGSIMAKSGNIFWWSDIVTHDGGIFRARALQTSQNNDQTMQRSNALQLATYTGSTDQFWHKRVTGSGQSLLFQLADTLAGGPDASPSYLTGIEIKQVSSISAGTQIGLYGAAPVARAAAITAPTAPSATYVQAEAQAMKTAVDAIRTALTGIGITF